MQRLVQGLVGGLGVGRSVVGCGLPLGVGGGVGGVCVVGGRVVGSGFGVCGSPLRCAWCGPVVWGRFGVRLGWWLGCHGGWVGSACLTLRHGRGDGLGLLLGWLRECWSGLRDLRSVREVWAKAMPVSVLHVRWGRSGGWHPHLHVLFLGDGCPDGFGERVLDGWGRRVEAVSGRGLSSAGVDWRLVSRSGGRVLLESESSHVDGLEPEADEVCSKPGLCSCSSCEPPSRFEVFRGLGRIGLTDDPGGLFGVSRAQARALLVEYMEATVGWRRWPTGTAHLSKAFGVPPVVGRQLELPFGEDHSDRFWVSTGLVRLLQVRAPGVFGLGVRGFVGDDAGLERFWGDAVGVRVVRDCGWDGRCVFRLVGERVDVERRAVLGEGFVPAV